MMQEQPGLQICAWVCFAPEGWENRTILLLLPLQGLAKPGAFEIWLDQETQV